MGRYVLNEGVRIYRTNNEIRVRKGVWSFWEMVINLVGEDMKVKGVINDIFEKLQEGKVIDTENLSPNLPKEKIVGITRVLREMQEGGLLITPEERSHLHKITEILLGYYYPELNIKKPNAILFFSDMDYPKKIAQDIGNHLGLNIEVLKKDVFDEILNIDLTTKVDYIDYLENLNKYSEYFSGYDCLVGCLSEPYVKFLRNLNRIVVKIEKPVSLGMMDGPFMHVLTVHPPETGCLECFENRIMARLEELEVYHKFIESQNNILPKLEYTPVAHILTAMTISEALLLSIAQKSKFMGRVLSVYIPTLEIQCEDILRLPYCPACGAVAKGQAKEMYLSSKALINKLLEEIEVTEEVEGR